MYPMCSRLLTFWRPPAHGFAHGPPPHREQDYKQAGQKRSTAHVTAHGLVQFPYPPLLERGGLHGRQTWPKGPC